VGTGEIRRWGKELIQIGQIGEIWSRSFLWNLAELGLAAEEERGLKGLKVINVR